MEANTTEAAAFGRTARAKSQASSKKNADKPTQWVCFATQPCSARFWIVRLSMRDCDRVRKLVWLFFVHGIPKNFRLDNGQEPCSTARIQSKRHRGRLHRARLSRAERTPESFHGISMSILNKFSALGNNLVFDNWPSALLQRLLFRKEQLVVYRKDGVTFLVDFAGGDAAGARMCLATDMYSRYFSLLPTDHPLTVLDLGANGGGFPLALMAGGFRIAKSVSVEMNPNTHTRLQFNLSYNGRGSCLAVNAAVAAKNGSVTLADNAGGTGESIYSQVLSPEEKSVVVPLITVDDIITTYFGNDATEPIDVCKMDIEGAEYEVLPSETCKQLKRAKFFIIEIHKHPDALQLVETIKSIGFSEVTDKGSSNGDVHLFKNVDTSA